MGGQTHASAASTPGKDLLPILQEAGWAPGPVWTGGKPRPQRDSIPDRPARSQSLYRLSCPAHVTKVQLQKVPAIVTRHVEKCLEEGVMYICLKYVYIVSFLDNEDIISHHGFI